MPGSSKSKSSFSGRHSFKKRSPAKKKKTLFAPATKRKTLNAETLNARQHASTLSITKKTPKHKQHNLLDAVVPVNAKTKKKKKSSDEDENSEGEEFSEAEESDDDSEGDEDWKGQKSKKCKGKRKKDYSIKTVSKDQKFVHLELPSQRNSILESHESTGDDQKVWRRTGEELELLLSKRQGEALVGQNMLALVHVSSYLTGLKQQLLVGVPRNARDALDLAGKLPLALKAIAIGIPPHELNIDPANGGLLGKFDAIIRGAGGAGGVGRADREMGVEIKGARTCRGLKTFQLGRLRPSSCFDHLLLVVRWQNPTDWTDMLQLDELFWLGHVPRAAFDRALADRFGASMPAEVKANVTMDSRRHSWLGPHIQWVKFKDLTRSWWNTNVLGVL
jgi:hypothetical protein